MNRRGARAPGRVNLIGEHVDYSEGFVLPIAIDRATTVTAGALDGDLVRLHSAERAQTLEFRLGEPDAAPRERWSDYVQGTALALLRRGVPLRGAELDIHSSVPMGAGLSSSAALEVSSALALLALAGEDMDPLALAKACQEAENDFVGLRSGIMDQLASVYGRVGHALLIDCRSLEVTPVAWALEDASIMVCDSHVKHELAGSAYNDRRAECESAAALLGVRTLRDVPPAVFAQRASELPEVLRKRARHVVTENTRVLDAVRALRRGDAAEFGALLNVSHASLRDDYEVSAPEIDCLVAAAQAVNGVYGSRLTGGGFGGSTVSIVRRDAAAAFEAAVRSAYAAAFGRDPSVIEVYPSAGAAQIEV
ncbi:MAG: galactokinase [Candidatus Velthaea sp.]